MIRCGICNEEIENWEDHIKSKLHQKLLEKFGQIMDSGNFTKEKIKGMLEEYREELRKEGY